MLQTCDNYLTLICSIASVFLDSCEALLALNLAAPDELAVALFLAPLHECVVAAAAAQLVARALEVDRVPATVRRRVPTSRGHRTAVTILAARVSPAAGATATTASVVLLRGRRGPVRRLLRLLQWVLWAACLWRRRRSAADAIAGPENAPQCVWRAVARGAVEIHEFELLNTLQTGAPIAAHQLRSRVLRAPHLHTASLVAPVAAAAGLNRRLVRCDRPHERLGDHRGPPVLFLQLRRHFLEWGQLPHTHFRRTGAADAIAAAHLSQRTLDYLQTNMARTRNS